MRLKTLIFQESQGSKVFDSNEKSVCVRGLAAKSFEIKLFFEEYGLKSFVPISNLKNRSLQFVEKVSKPHLQKLTIFEKTGLINLANLL